MARNVDMRFKLSIVSDAIGFEPFMKEGFQGPHQMRLLLTVLARMLLARLCSELRVMKATLVHH